MKKLLNAYFPKDENIFISIIILPLKLINTFIAITCYVAVSPFFVLNYFFGKVVGLFRSKV